LVELVLEKCALTNKLKCLDLGTGTGAIALALASEKPLWEIDAVDFNESAVTLAKRNAVNLNLEQVNIYQSDWFEGVDLNTKFDIIVSNPPYIDENDKHISQGDVRYEPLSALVAPKEGLGDIEHIAEMAKDYLNDGGMIFFEHGFEQAKLVQDLLSISGYKEPKTVKDLNGQDRITWAFK
jgi:release factor glutamine methyltransferase